MRGDRDGAWPARPVTVIVGVTVPRQLTQASKAVGSAEMPASALTPRRTHMAPPAPDDSSSVLVQKTTSPVRRTPWRCNASRAITRPATPPFMSLAPRP